MVEPIVDRGQKLPVPELKVIGVIDSEVEFEAVNRALNAAGYADSKISVLHGQDGVDLMERLREIAFFGDFERAVADQAIKELQEGHYVLAVSVHDRDEAVRIANIAEPHGGHGFTYFGRWINEQLTQ